MAAAAKNTIAMPVLIGLLALAVGLVVGSKLNKPEPTTGSAGLVGLTGSGAPSGPHYNLNIIGVPKAKSASMTGGEGHRIFVGLGQKDSSVNTRIMLSQSADGTFRVLDANGTDGTASFQLPAPGGYSIYARPLGKPGGQAQMTTCAFDPLTGEEICSTSFEVFVRDTGKSNFRNVTTSLTTIVIDATLTEVIDACGSQTVSLFDPCLQDYFWSYDNSGLKLLQLRFYQET